MKRNIFLILISISFFFLQAENTAKKNGKALMKPGELRCEYLKDPIGIDVHQPRLSWKFLNTDQRGKTQTAYQILVASDKKLLDSGNPDLWNSGTINSGESVNIVYQGKELKTSQECFWKVRIKDEKANWSQWSETAFWSMGLFASDWNARWIGRQIENSEKNSDSIAERKADPWLRKLFQLPDTPQKSTIYIASIGYHELYVNGVKVGDKVLVPSATDHKSRARYITYDITDYLNKGENVIALWLGTSWSIFPAYQTDDKPGAPIVLAQADILFSDGESMQIITDESWKSFPSPNTLLGYWDAHQFAGEEYDGFMEVEDWSKVEYDDSHWYAVDVFNPQLTISADKTQANRLIKEIKPIAIDEIEPGIYLVDMGINYTGWFQIELEGSPGDRIGFQFSERINTASSYGLYSVYKMGPSGKGIFCNRFNYMSGRWIRITGIADRPGLDQIKGWMIRPDYEQAGHFECDQTLLNEIYNASLWTYENLSLGNYVVDCPQRERRGYGGDALATTRMGLGNYDLGAFYTKWMEDWRDVQQPDGNVPYTAPTYVGGGGPSWSGYCVILPWEIYTQYGDKRILEESFPTIQHWLNFLETKSKDDMLVRWGGKWSFLGDWLWPDARSERSMMEKSGKALGDTRETLFYNNCHWIHTLELAAKIAAVIGRDDDSQMYDRRADEVRKAVHAEFFNKEDYSYVNGYPSYLAIALYINLPPQHMRDSVWKRLEKEIIINRKGHFWGGITAGSYLFHTLLDNNKNDLLYTMISKTDFPSWGDMLKHGLGTFFEDWECRGSALHSSYLYVGSWFVEALGGIRRGDAGFKHFIIEPWINQQNGPRKVNSSYDSLYGHIVSNWEIDGENLQINISIPPNTTALVRLNDIDFETLKENQKSFKKTKGVSYIVQETANTTGLLLQSGSYNFTARLK